MGWYVYGEEPYSWLGHDGQLHLGGGGTFTTTVGLICLATESGKVFATEGLATTTFGLFPGATFTTFTVSSMPSVYRASSASSNASLRSHLYFLHGEHLHSFDGSLSGHFSHVCFLPQSVHFLQSHFEQCGHKTPEILFLIQHPFLQISHNTSISSNTSNIFV